MQCMVRCHIYDADVPIWENLGLPCAGYASTCVILYRIIGVVACASNVNRVPVGC